MKIKVIFALGFTFLFAADLAAAKVVDTNRLRAWITAHVVGGKVGANRLQTWITANEWELAVDPPPPPPPPLTSGFPKPTITGVPAGWTPARTFTSTVRVTAAGSILQDVRIVNGNLEIAATNVTIRRVEVQGGLVKTGCYAGTLLEDVSIVRAPGQRTTSESPEAVGPGGYTARRVKIDGLPEGFRVSGKDNGCGPVVIEDSFARIVAPDSCSDWHGDTLQGYYGNSLNLSNVTLIFQERSGCYGTSAFFYPVNQGNTSVVINKLLVQGGGFPFRLGMPGSVAGLRIVNNSWGYGPIDVDCRLVAAWEAQIVTIDANFQPTGTVGTQPCDTGD